jgi:hypothetical protein
MAAGSGAPTLRGGHLNSLWSQSREVPFARQVAGRLSDAHDTNGCNVDLHGCALGLTPVIDTAGSTLTATLVVSDHEFSCRLQTPADLFTK